MKTADELGTLLKPVSALAIVPKSSSITRVGRQAYNSMLILAQAQGEGNEMFRAPLSRILKGFSAAADTSKEVKRHLRSMMSTLVEWQSPSPAETTPWTACVLLAEARLEKVNGETWVLWAYPPTIRAELLNPQRFAQIKMKTVAQLRTHAAVALYEICARYQSNPSGVTSRQHWTWWLPVLTGAPLETRNTEYRFFKRDYLRPAIEDINEISDLKIEVIEHKLGRSIDEIQFAVERKGNAADADNGPHEPMDVSQIVRAQQLGIPSAAAEDMHFRFGLDSLRDALDSLARRIEQRGFAPVMDRTAYLRSLLNGVRSRKNAGDGVELQPAQSSTTPVQTPTGGTPSPLVRLRSRSTPTADGEPKELDPVRQRQMALRQIVESMDDEERDALLVRLRLELAQRGGMASVVRRIDAGTWRSPLVLTELVALYAREIDANN